MFFNKKGTANISLKNSNKLNSINKTTSEEFCQSLHRNGSNNI